VGEVLRQAMTNMKAITSVQDEAEKIFAPEPEAIAEPVS
jgi:hypothetical protein